MNEEVISKTVSIADTEIGKSLVNWFINNRDLMAYLEFHENSLYALDFLRIVQCNIRWMRLSWESPNLVQSEEMIMQQIYELLLSIEKKHDANYKLHKLEIKRHDVKNDTA